jgi:CheY-like chemotaxis protein
VRRLDFLLGGGEMGERIRAFDWAKHPLGPATPRLERTRLIAVTGYGQESDRTRAEGAGFDAYLVKPVDLDELIELIDTLVRSGSGPEIMDVQPSP